MNKNWIAGIVLLLVIVGGLYFSGNLSVIGGENCNIVKDYPNACDDYTDCKYIEFEGNNLACINGEKIFYNYEYELGDIQPVFSSGKGGQN